MGVGAFFSGFTELKKPFPLPCEKGFFVPPEIHADRSVCAVCVSVFERGV